MDPNHRDHVRDDASGTLRSQGIPSLNLEYHQAPQLPTTPLGKQNTRSFYHSSYHDDTNPERSPWAQHTATGIRDQTAELANYALSDVGSIYSSTPPRNVTSAHSNRELNPSFLQATRSAGPIYDISESPSPTAGIGRNSGTSYLTNLFRSSSEAIYTSKKSAASHSQDEPIAANGASAPMSERDLLLPKTGPVNGNYSAIPQHNGDIEAQRNKHSALATSFNKALTWPKYKRFSAARTIFCCEFRNKRQIWEKGVVKPASYIPPVVLGLLLNVLDGLSYGMILFPLGEDIFKGLGADGLSIFYVSCIVSQLVYSLGGSVFKGGVGSEMIEVVPFFHQMAFTIINQVGEDNPKSVLATTILAYALSSILTGAVFSFLGYAKLGSLIGFFPRHILVGCIGGVGWFLLATAIEVSAQLGGSINYNLATLKLLFEPATLALWIVPLLLALLLIFVQHFIKHPLLVPLYFMAIPAFFYLVVAAIPGLNLELLRVKGWVFNPPEAGVPFWHFYTLYDFKAVDWRALLNTVPAMFALTFFGILHVPINVPALGVSTGEDNVDVDRELIAHGISNALSGCVGSIQNYLVYSNSILFIRSGGDSRIAGVMLAIGTAGIMVMGPTVVGYIPIMVVGSLIFLLGIELMREALYDTWGRLSKLEYLTILAIVVTMGTWDFVIGIGIGIVLACASFVVQASQKSPIRAHYSGAVVRSTVRRHPVQQQFLREVGRQIHVCKLAGYMFFGTIASVERTIRDMLEERNFDQRPIRFLIIDLSNVNGIDFSAAEAFTRMRRLLSTKYVEMILSGVTPDSDVGKGLRAVGMWANDDGVQVFEDLNAALEACENEFLTALYRHKEEETRIGQTRVSKYLDVPKSKTNYAVSIDSAFNSPRHNWVHQAATITLKAEEAVRPSKWSNFKEPLPLMLQIFSEMTDKNEDFWFKAIPFFQRKEYPENTVLFQRGDKATEFYLLEEGMFRAEYDFEQGRYNERIVAGTTCGELPFFAETPRSATVIAEKTSVAWVMNEDSWENIQAKHPDVAQELLRISLKLTSERMAAITSYVLTTAG